MSDHISKRQRTTGSFSPFHSPPYQGAKPGDQTKASPIVHPNTPTSPPYTSMSSRPNGRSATTAVAPLSEMTPPSSVTISQQNSQLSASATNPLPFPGPALAGTAGVALSLTIDSDGDAMMADSQDDGAMRPSEHRQSNHNRQGKGVVAAADGVSGKALFNSCQSSHEVSRPHGSQNLFELYGLNDLARSVARNDPNTGEKINKLRKSYEGHIKAMQISGKPKAVKLDGAFTELLAFPEEEYEIQKVAGKEMNKALNTEQTGLNPDFDALLTKAFTAMGPGPLPPSETQRYRAYLGTDEVSKAKVAPEGIPNRTMPPRSTTPLPGNSSATSQRPRPERAGAKRTYTDISFQGYGEGFTDDGFADSTGGEDNGQGGIKKRRLGGFERTSHQVEVGGVRR
ncbi:Rox3-domain-containing protein [Melanomma pulvis-pyrius CBS 109.77]|uniref:Mediator of RNA polymerase II transcription subunit 19 n=1 Tax=Melanomma pulvis-pyrius CBS 109.77 TaxID=1314802 RepID=A0A6A6X9E7_9PLEO|nr:Rox3-domain-containing protein [Melanomma pulvis-pyrius CBS 109.77]